MLVFLGAFVLFLALNGKLAAYAAFVTTAAPGSPATKTAAAASSASSSIGGVINQLQTTNNLAATIDKLLGGSAK